MTPGAYLRGCREAAGLTLDDVALCTETIPPVSARSRAEWLATIENDAAPIAITTALRLHTVFEFDWRELVALLVAADLVPISPADLTMCLALQGRSIAAAAAALAGAGAGKAAA